jgi:hypothetical protein
MEHGPASAMMKVEPPMSRNVEIKAHIDSVEALISPAGAIADRGPMEISQDDTFFRCDSGRLKLRTFADGSGELIVLENPKSWRTPMNDRKPFRTFGDFYPFYLGEHANGTCRRLHFAGTSIAVALLVAAVALRWWWLIAIAFVQGYAFAWVGHFFFEHNKPATFKYPIFSLMGDWRLWWDILCGRVRL